MKAAAETAVVAAKQRMKFNRKKRARQGIKSFFEGASSACQSRNNFGTEIVVVMKPLNEDVPIFRT